MVSHSVHSPTPFLLGEKEGGGEPPNQIFKKTKRGGGGGLTRSQFLKGVAGKEGVTFSGESCN